jgi:ribose transport system substrate-binding protein
MHELSRREALRLSAVGVSGLIAGPVLAGCGTSSSASAGPATAVSDQPGVALAPFDSGLPAGPATGLARRVAWANTADIDIFIQLANGIARAASDTGLGYLTADADGDPQANVNQIDTFLARGVGGMTIQPLDEAAQTPVLLRALSEGVCVIGIIMHPCVLQIAASQYPIGYKQGKAAAEYITAHLGGKATVFVQNQGSVSPQLQLRTNGALAGLKTGGSGITVLNTTVPPAAYASIAGTFQYFTTELQRQPSIDVVLGDDSFVLGAYRALEQSGSLREEMYLSGVDGDRGSLALIKEGTPYRASLAFAWPLMGYGMGRFTADWIDGKQIPRIMVATTTLVDSPAAAAAFEADNADLAGTFADRRKYETYLPLLGNVSYAQRHAFWNVDYVPR